MPMPKAVTTTLQPTFFADQQQFRKWLEKYASTKTELIAGFYKVGTGKPSMTWSESVDQALCYGWIDGVRRSIDAERYCIRFTPRKPKSIWSAVNMKKMDVLKDRGLMQPAGLAAYEKRQEGKSGIYSYEKAEVPISAEFQKILEANPTAWQWFQSAPPSYKKPVTNWIMSAKQEATRVKRLEELIADSAAGIRVKHLRY